jgi:hypothetical protein
MHAAVAITLISSYHGEPPTIINAQKHIDFACVFYADLMYMTATGGALYIGRERAARVVLTSYRYHAVWNTYF